MAAMVNVGGKLVPANQMFKVGTPTTAGYHEVDAATAANLIQSHGLKGANGQWYDGAAGGWEIKMGDPVEAPKPAEAPKT